MQIYSSFSLPSWLWEYQPSRCSSKMPMVMLHFSLLCPSFSPSKKSCWLYLQNIRRLWPVRTASTAITTVQATIISRLLLLCPLQAVVLTVVRRIPRDISHIMPATLKTLLWLLSALSESHGWSGLQRPCSLWTLSNRNIMNYTGPPRV